MNKDSMDIFREMDTLAAYLFAQMTRDFPGGIPQQSADRRAMLRGSGPPQELENRGLSERSGSAPVTEVHLTGDEVMVITELPGATHEGLQLDLQDRELVIDADCETQHYRTTASLPPVDPASMRVSCKNGVLEVTFRILCGTSECEK